MFLGKKRRNSRSFFFLKSEFPSQKGERQSNENEMKKNLKIRMREREMDKQTSRKYGANNSGNV